MGSITFVKREMVMVSPDQSEEVQVTIRDLDPGRYVVTVFSLANTTNSTETEATFFTVGKRRCVSFRDD